MLPQRRGGSRGCAEAIAAEPAILGEIRRALANTDLKIDEALARAQTGSSATTAILHRAGQTVGRALATVANLVGTELIVMSSEQHRFAHLLHAEISDAFRQHLCGPATACRLITVNRPFEDWARAPPLWQSTTSSNYAAGSVFVIQPPAKHR